ncbi:4-demethylwyosine synthase TYW1 [Candidatus Woesearchaeota archaeon]|nr:4-demethylwyosine synthase TYW1 [Candidatus Woesearchaeota archaeon]
MKMLMKIADAKRKDLERQGYRVVGNHSAVKVCLWTKKSLRDEGTCYKQRFYGINCHRCVQMTPALPTCTLRCVWCWRDIDHTIPKWIGGADPPGKIIDECIMRHTKLLYGFGGLDKANKRKYDEAMRPIHFAISLAGEPTMYPDLPGLIAELKKRKMSSFVVTNGTNPDVLRKLARSPPTQLYITLPVPSEEDFQRNCSPLIKDGWKRISESLEVMKALKRKTRTTIRLTLAKGRNMKDPEKYADLIRIADPLFLEVKAFVSVGFSKRRLEYKDMPLHSEIVEFSKELAKFLGVRIVDEQPESRVVLLMRRDLKSRVMDFGTS